MPVNRSKFLCIFYFFDKSTQKSAKSLLTCGYGRALFAKLLASTWNMATRFDGFMSRISRVISVWRNKTDANSSGPHSRSLTEVSTSMRRLSSTMAQNLLRWRNIILMTTGNATLNVSDNNGGCCNAKLTEHRRSQGRKGPPPKFLAYLVNLCFERQCPKQNAVARLKSKFATPKNCGLWLRHYGEVT